VEWGKRVCGSPKGPKSNFFLDRKNGWIGGRGALFRTFDGGASWKPVKIDIQADADVSAIHFVDPLVGWIALQRRATDILQYQNNHFWLFQTTDGGQTWRLQQDGLASRVTRVNFINEREGWFTGGRYLGLEPYRFVNLIFHTSDQGLHWTDVSEDLNRIAKSDQGVVNDLITDIKPEGSLAATILTISGKIFKTGNGGQSWEQMKVSASDWGWPTYNRLGLLAGGRLWFSGTADSSMGLWAILTVEENDRWIQNRLNSVYIADVLFISENQILACGSISRIDSPENGQRDGVVLYSSDAGRTWSIAYRTELVRKINALAVHDPKYAVAVGNNGLLLTLKASSDQAPAK
jgi:photosystem II stability/assembly factor-like uncharacterized protein